MGDAAPCQEAAGHLNKGQENPAKQGERPAIANQKQLREQPIIGHEPAGPPAIRRDLVGTASDNALPHNKTGDSATVHDCNSYIDKDGSEYTYASVSNMSQGHSHCTQKTGIDQNEVNDLSHRSRGIKAAGTNSSPEDSALRPITVSIEQRQQKRRNCVIQAGHLLNRSSQASQRNVEPPSEEKYPDPDANQDRNLNL